MILGNFIKSDGRIRHFETVGGDEIHFIGTNALHGDLGDFKQQHKAAESRIMAMENRFLYNSIADSLGAQEIRIGITQDSFRDYEDALVTKMALTWEKSVDTGLREFVVMMDQLNEEVTEEMIAQIILPFLDEHIAEPFYFSPSLRRSLKTAIRRTWTGGYVMIGEQIGIKIPRSDYIDTRAQAWLRNDTRFWLRHRWETHTRQKIADTAVEVGIEQGLGRREVGRAMAKAFKGITGENPYYWELVGSNAVTRARTWSGKVAMDQAGIVESRWVALNDERQCPTCGQLDGTVLSVKKALDLMNESLNTTDYLAARAITPSINFSAKRAKAGKAPYYFSEYDIDGNIINKRYFKQSKLNDGKWLVNNGVDGPQAHPGCRCTETAEI